MEGVCLHLGEWLETRRVGEGGGGGSSVNEVHSFRSQLAPEERQWGGKLNLKERKLCQQVTEACFDQTHSEVKRSHITGPIWRQYYALHRLPFFSHTACQCTGKPCCRSKNELNIGAFVAWIYGCWNVSQESSRCTYSLSGNHQKSAASCKTCLEGWFVYVICTWNWIWIEFRSYMSHMLSMFTHSPL